jgi:hypothetical protein
MSSEENKQVALNVIKALNARDLSLWRSIYQRTTKQNIQVCRSP